jgi:Leucine-rich repeat (LRR) protein
MKMVAALPAEQQVEAVSKKLRELNPGFDGKVMLSNTPIAGPPRIENGAVTEMGFFTDKVTDISPVRVLSGLKSLDCLGSDYNGILTDISPLQGMQLTKLILVGNRKLTDISPLKGMPLTFLWLGASDQLFDLSPLKGMPLTELGVRATAVGDLSPLRGMKLTTLDIFDCRNVSDLSPLKGMNLESLVVSQTKVSDLSVLAGMPLKDLQLDFKPERDKELLRSIKTLEKISNKPAAEFWKEVEEQQKGKKLGFQVPGFDAWMKDVSALPAEQLVKAVVKKLRELNPGFDGKVFSEDWNSPPKIENGVVTQLAFKTDDVSDISPVHALTGLKVLLCSMAENPGKGSLADLSPLVGLKLMRLGIAGTEVSDLSPLAGMPIVEINCSVTRIADLSPLRGMTSLQILGFEKTLVSSLLPLRGMHLRALNCESTRVTDLSPLEGMSLIEFAFTPRKTNTGIDVIRRMKVVNSIGVDRNHLLPPPEFWKRFDAGEFGKPNSTAATPDHKPITNINDPAFQQWMKTVAAMPADKQVEAVSKKLVELNPGFDGKLTGGNGKEWSMIRNGVVEEVKFCTDNVTDISPLRVFQRLTLLRCSPAFPNKSKLSDLSPLQGMPLTLFECTFSNVSNLTPLQGMPITILSCEATLVADLSPLRGIPLRELNFHNTQVSDLSPLKGMSLTKLNCYGTQVSDLSPLQGMNLVEIDITPKNITKGLDVIRQMKSLNRIEIGWRESDKFSVSEFWKKYDDGEFNK